MNYYFEVWKKYANFKGRSPRKEYWVFFLVNLVIIFVISSIERFIGMSASIYKSGLANLYGLAILIPSLAVSVRRLHDTNRSGWWILIGLIPFIGSVVILVFMVIDSQPGENKYGPNPKEIKIG